MAQEKPEQSDSWVKILKWIRDNSFLAIAIYFAGMFWFDRQGNKERDERREESKDVTIKAQDVIIKAQSQLIEGYANFKKQTDRAERKYTIKTDTIYVN